MAIEIRISMANDPELIRDLQRVQQRRGDKLTTATARNLLRESIARDDARVEIVMNAAPPSRN